MREISLNSILPDEETEPQGGFITYPEAEGHSWTSLRDWLLAEGFPPRWKFLPGALTRTTGEEALGGNH